MTNTPSSYIRVANGFADRLAGVADDQWSLPTPCSDWTVRDLVVHVVETHRRVYRIVHPDAGDPAVGDVDVIEAWRHATAQIQDAITDPTLAATPVQGRGGEQPFAAVVAGLLTCDTLCHTWDLARATGQDEELDAVAISSCHEMLRGIDDAIRVPGGFAPALEPPEGANAQTAFLCFTGRAV